MSPTDVTPAKATGELNILCYTLLGLFVISFSVWLMFAWTSYGNRYAAHADGFRQGGVRAIEVTLVKDDARNLACASDVVTEDLHCGFRANQQPFAPEGPGDAAILRPYNTVDSMLFLGAGLWSQPVLAGPLPKDRFTVVCNFHMLGAVRSVSLRWSESGAFGTTKDSVPVGRLTDCVIPR